MIDDRRVLVATACAVLAAAGHEDLFLGHVSCRLDAASFLMKPSGMGLREVRPEDVLVVDLSGRVLHGSGPIHHEHPIHTSIYRSRPDVGAVVHTHSPGAKVLTAQADPRLRALGQESLGFAGALRVFEDPRLVSSDAIADRFIDALGDAQSILMRNHGATVLGDSIPTAVTRAVLLDRAIELELRTRSAGEAAPIDDPLVDEMTHYFEHSYRDRAELIWGYLVRTAGAIDHYRLGRQL